MQGLSRLRSAIPGRAMISSASLLSSITDGIIRTGLLLPPHHRCPGEAASNMSGHSKWSTIKRGTGEDKDAAAFERVVYEGYAPHGVAIMMEVVTDNRNRTVAELRHTLSKAGGTMAEAGAVAWQFRRSAYFSVPAADVDREKVFEMAVEAGADGGGFGGDFNENFAPAGAFKVIND